MAFSWVLLRSYKERCHIVARLQTPVKNSKINLRPVVEVQVMYLLNMWQ